MSRYRKIDPRIWVDDKFRALSEKERLFFFYLLTSPHSTAWGAYVIDDLYAQADLGYSIEDVKSCFFSLSETGLIFRCSRTRLVCFPNWFKYNPPTNKKSMIACARGIESLPRSSLLTRFISSAIQLIPELANCLLTDSEKFDDEQEQEQEQEQEHLFHPGEENIGKPYLEAMGENEPNPFDEVKQ